MGHAGNAICKQETETDGAAGRFYIRGEISYTMGDNEGRRRPSFPLGTLCMVHLVVFLFR